MDLLMICSSASEVRILVMGLLAISGVWKALDVRGIHTFFDDEELQKGDEITPALVEAIGKSRMAIVVLSKNYASSSFCLRELSEILDNIRSNGRPVWPIFYDVDPSDVRKLTGTYGEAMAKHEEKFNHNMGLFQRLKNALYQVVNETRSNHDMELLQKWKNSLYQVSNMSGFHYKNRDVYEHEFIGKIVDQVSREIKPVTSLHGLVYFQNILLSQIVQDDKIQITNVREGMSKIQHMLQKKKVLLLLDDVDNMDQLDAIAGKAHWFGLGSRVIITTRDKRLLACHGVESTYDVKELDEKIAFQLFIQKAFKTAQVTPYFENVVNRAVTYASGLPLALKVIGSHFINKTVEQCESILDRYERIPDKKIQTILRVSFDSLEEEEKCIFLDIACCFRGCKLADVEKILNAHHGDSRKDHIIVLVEKSLIKISESGHVTLHDLIEDMGKEIVRQESPKEPEKRSRLWSPKDITGILKENTVMEGTSKNEIIYLDSPTQVECDGQAFKKMGNLKSLIIRCGLYSKYPIHLPNSLRVLQWNCSEISCLYSDILLFDSPPKELVICEIGCHYSTSFVSRILFNKEFENMRVF